MARDSRETMPDEFPLYAVVMSLGIVIGDIVRFRLKDNMALALRGSRILPILFLYMFILFIVIAGGDGETPLSLPRKLKNALWIMLILTGLNFVPPSMLPFAILTVAVDYGLHSLMNGAAAGRDTETVETIRSVRQWNKAVILAIIAHGVFSTWSREGLSGVIDDAFPSR